MVNDFYGIGVKGIIGEKLLVTREQVEKTIDQAKREVAKEVWAFCMEFEGEHWETALQIQVLDKYLKEKGK